MTQEVKSVTITLHTEGDSGFRWTMKTDPKDIPHFSVGDDVPIVLIVAARICQYFETLAELSKSEKGSGAELGSMGLRGLK